MKPIIVAEKPSQAKAYAEAFTVKSRHKTHIEGSYAYLVKINLR